MHQQFGALNWLAIGVYTVAMLAVGVYFSKRASASSDDYFKAGGRIPAWAAGFSIYATTLSAITFMSIPEKAYLTDWAYSVGNIAIFAIVPILVHFYVPFFRKLDVTTAYEYLEERFGVTLRILGSVFFVLFHVGRIAIVIYLPTLALTAVSDINPYLIAALVGVACIIYTFLGGVEGVIWSDVIQGIILLAGAAVVIVVALVNSPGSVSHTVSQAASAGKFYSGDNFSLSTVSVSIPIIFLGSVLNNVQSYTASQDVVQRYQTTPSVQATQRSLYVNGILALITIPIFYGMGTVLYTFYQGNGGLPDGVKTSAIVPYYILTELPGGVAGLIIGGILAAAQSTISSSLNSISACITVDIRNRLMPQRGEASVLFSRIVIVTTGVLSTSIALWLIASNKGELWDLFLTLTGLCGIPIAAVFALGIFTVRANRFGVLGGVVLGVLAGYAMGKTDLGPFVISIVAFTVTLVVGYVLSLVVNRTDHQSRDDTLPLTIHGKNLSYARKSVRHEPQS
ncbi:sodium:solute symporter [Corynebacterium kroppenstedtii]|uniref:sodium:solute symporter n=1 Tax=Corynebacterium sp. PCR 32 TaxID=3351342 RepID=UPI0030968B9C